LANFVQFIRMLVLSGGLGGWATLGYATARRVDSRPTSILVDHY